MKIGLVLEGGAHRTIFSCGVMDALLDAGIRADYVIGVSAGITYGVSYVSMQRSRNREMLRRFVRSPRYAGMLHRINPKNRAYYNLHFTFDVIPNKLLPFDYETYEAFAGETVAVVTDLQNGQAEYLSVTAKDRKWRVLQATCALPILFRPVEIDGRLYADGGISDSIPYQKALSDGCDKIIVVLTREREYVKTPESAMHFAAKHYHKRYPQYADALMKRHERYNTCISELYKLEETGKAYVIAPENTLGVKRTDKRVEKLMALYAQGYALTMQQLPSLRKYLTSRELQET
jgi:predicted patatin/cPLA2 family phospholipase